MALGRHSTTDPHSWPALMRLLRLQTRGKLRRSLAQLRNPQRAALSWFAFALLALFLTLELITLLVRKPVEPGVLMTFVPLGMLGICLLKLSRICLGQQHAGVELRPVEVIFLQAGPFTSGQVRAFKLVAHTISVMITAAFASVFLWADVHLWVAGFLGAFSAMLFMYLLYMLVAVVAARVGSRTYNLGRAAFCLFVSATLASSLIIALVDISIAGSGGATQLFGAWPWGLARMMQTPAGQVMLAPFNLFTQMTLAADYRQLAFLLLPGCTINALLFWSILRAEGYMLNRNLLTEQQTYLSGSGGQEVPADDRGRPATACQRCVPPLPWLAGAGP
ncbi:MAG: hypothetical protein OES79_06035, partial [Planctomycetota bacterium]|nr:hypothetical protein [Planctomycetota bacterium]